jgi:hypothetical protein
MRERSFGLATTGATRPAPLPVLHDIVTIAGRVEKKKEKCRDDSEDEKRK